MVLSFKSKRIVDSHFESSESSLSLLFCLKLNNKIKKSLFLSFIQQKIRKFLLCFKQKNKTKQNKTKQKRKETI
jgi:hypothetical protein